jgi:hypothetical protein
MGLTAAQRLAQRYANFIAIIPIFFLLGNLHSCAHLTLALNLCTEEVMQKIVQLIF